MIAIICTTIVCVTAFLYNSILFRNEYGQLQALEKENKE